MPVKTVILCINGGSSSLKFSLFPADDAGYLYKGTAKGIGTEDSVFEIRDQDGQIIYQEKELQQPQDAAGKLIEWFKKLPLQLAAIGHRLVQGGMEHRAPELITKKLLADLQKVQELDPGHLPGELALIRLFQSSFPETPQVACFDTWFHRDLPSQVKYYPLPEKYAERGLIRYGFHGLSYEYVWQKLVKEIPASKTQKIIIAHLGSGASITAIENGISIDTTMGLTPAGGLVMSSRLGDIDPGALLFLLRQEHLSVDELDELINKRSGLKAIAGSGDLQELLEREKQDGKAAAAVQLFCYTARKFIGALAAGLGGLHMLIFTGGTGENSPVIRERICEGLAFMGLRLDPEANRQDEIISAASSRVMVRVIKTDEEWMIAKHTRQILSKT
jgi:acetate kinase